VLSWVGAGVEGSALAGALVADGSSLNSFC
jgi:hypothetical protein